MEIGLEVFYDIHKWGSACFILPENKNSDSSQTMLILSLLLTI